MTTEEKGQYLYCQVRILDVPYHLDSPYEYYIPNHLKDEAVVGAFVSVPFGRANRKTAAVVTSLLRKPSYKEVKPVEGVSVKEGILDGEALELCRFLCGYTLCTFGEAVKTVVPTAAVKLDEMISVTDSEKGLDKLSEKAIIFYTYIKARGSVSRARLRSHFGEDSVQLILTLLKLKLIKKENRVAETSNNRYTTYAKILRENVHDIDATVAKMRSPVQASILRLLFERERESAEKINELMGKNVSPQLSSLEKKGLVTVEKVESYRNPYLLSETEQKKDDSPLSPQQEKAYRTIRDLYEKDGPSAVLLHGVTGSGKTKVIKAMIDKALSDKKGVIMLVPEISLTPQTVGYFCSQYGDRVAVVHSNLSRGERYDGWKRIKRGEADVVIGTRSAIFAPVKNLGLIVIDEEQEHTYKSETDPKYLAHDIARFRSGKTGAMMLLSSATPSIASYHKAVTGAYTLVEMTERYGDATLPEVIISDMRYEADSGNVSPIGTVLTRELEKTYNEGKQSIVFLNRRGYNSAVTCRICSEAVVCPNCSVSLTYHTRLPLGEADDAKAYFDMRAKRGVLTCHYCGYKTRLPEICPSCGAEHFRFMGCGTQQAEEALSKKLPDAKILRMDMDTTSGKKSHSEILEKFRKGEADILLGTQMVTKGHDFPKVTLVGVMNADSSLHLDDFRAAEKTFSMLTQVVGRAGRGKDAGKAVVQTSNPDSNVIKLAARQDYKSFYEQEIKLRRALVFPPFCDIGVITLSGTDEALLGAASARLSERVRELLQNEFSDVEAVVFGPFEAPVYKVQNTCRMRLVVKCRLNKRTREFFGHLLCEFGKKVPKLTISADLNPSSL